jgi:hypothetical protein
LILDRDRRGIDTPLLQEIKSASTKVIIPDTAGNKHADPLSCQPCSAACEIRRRPAKLWTVRKHIPENLSDTNNCVTFHQSPLSPKLTPMSTNLNDWASQTAEQSQTEQLTHMFEIFDMI